jgi:hypothetical protein
MRVLEFKKISSFPGCEALPNGSIPAPWGGELYIRYNDRSKEFGQQPVKKGKMPRITTVQTVP